MTVAYFVVAALLALVALASGLVKLVRSKEKLAEMGAPTAWTRDFTGWQLKTIGAFEVLAAVGVILPMALRIVPVLSPLAALGLAFLHVAAFIVNARRGERPALDMGIFALAGVTAALGFLVLGGA